MTALHADPATLPALAAGLVDDLRARRPRVHCLMNTVVQKFVADGLTALGAVPSMTSAAEEVAAFVHKADALVVNLGTLDAGRRQAIGVALDAAAREGRRWSLDPAHCDYSPSRAGFARALLAREPAVLRVNRDEHELLAAPARIVTVTTGSVDRITWNGTALRAENGHPLMAQVTGTGCLSGALIAAFLAIEGNAFTAAAAAAAVLGVAGEIAARSATGPGSFQPALLDALANLSPADLIAHARISNEQD